MSFSFAREKCLVCGRTCFAMPICRSCADAAESSLGEDIAFRCAKCGKPLLSEQGLCMSCRESPVLHHTDTVFPMFTYRLWWKKLLFEWKMHDRRNLSPLFARFFAKGLSLLEVDEKNTVIVPVPPRPGKKREKGWDQMGELSSYLSSVYGYSVLPLLKRHGRGQQKKKGREERLSSVGTLYGKSDCAGRILSIWARRSKSGNLPENAVIVDDVITTGATVENCAAVLKELGIRKVSVLSLLIVD